MRFDKSKRRLEVADCETGEIQNLALESVNIMLIGLGVTLSPAIMQHFANNDVIVLFCDWKGRPVCSVYPWGDAHGRVAARQRAQASLSVPRTKNAWMQVVKAKIRGQASNLQCLNRSDWVRLARFANDVRSGDPSNVEGHAAKVYWKSLFADPSFVRVQGMRAGDRNSMLDYGYTILRGHCLRAVLAAGLNPTLGIFHRNRANHFALVDDLIEPFRPVVDWVVATMPEDAVMEDKGVRRQLVQSTLLRFQQGGYSVPKTMTDLSQQFGLYVEGEIERFEVPYWKGAVNDEQECEEEV